MDLKNADEKKAGNDNDLDILFIVPPSGVGNHFRFHFGISYLMTALKRKGLKSDIFIDYSRFTFNKLIDVLASFKTKVYGFSCYNSNLHSTRLICRELKKRKKCTIIVGGPSATFDDNLMKLIPEIDLRVKFYAEETLPEIINCLKKCEPLQTIPNLVFRDADKLVHTPTRPFLPCHDGNIDHIASPYLEGVTDGTEYPAIITSRGCPFECTYCNFSAMSSRKLYFHSVGRIIEELKIIAANNKEIPEGHSVSILDDCFTVNPQRTLEICTEIKKNSINLPLYAEARADRCNRRLLEAMKEAGIIYVNFGLESASEKVLREIKKPSPGVTPKEFLRKVKENVAIANEIGINTSVSVIFGLPGEDYGEALKTIRFVETLDVDIVQTNILFVLPGTELYANLKRYPELRVEEEKFGLLLYTDPPDYINKLPRISRCSYQNIIKNERERLSTILSCSLLTEEEKLEGVGQLCLLDDELTDEQIRFIKERMCFCGKVFFHSGSDEKTEQNIKKMINDDVPTLSFTAFNIDEEFVRFSFLDNMIHHGNKDLILNPETFRDLFYEKSGIHRVLVSETLKRGDILMSLSEKSEYHEYLKIIEEAYSESNACSDPENRGKILPLCSCQVIGKRCNLSEGLGSVFIQGNDIKCSLSGPKICSLNDDLSEVVKNHKSRIINLEKERGCEDCEISNHCNKCVLKGSFDSHAEACDFRRNLFKAFNSKKK